MKDKAKELFKKKYEKLLKDHPDEGYLPYKDVVKTKEYRLIIDLMVDGINQELVGFANFIMSMGNYHVTMKTKPESLANAYINKLIRESWKEGSSLQTSSTCSRCGGKTSLHPSHLCYGCWVLSNP